MVQRIALAILMVTAGCHQTLRGETKSPNPLVQPDETLRYSETVTILSGDKDLNVPSSEPRTIGYARAALSVRYRLKNRARFRVVSKDRLRFEVSFEHKWPRYADPGQGWRATLVDDRGHIYYPARVDSRGDPKHIVQMWDQETRVLGGSNGFTGDVQSGRTPLASISLFRGAADFEFSEPDLINVASRSYVLVLHRPGQAFVFKWKLVDEKKIASN